MERRRWKLNSSTTMADIVSTPGDILLEEFLVPLGISQYRLAKAIGKPQSAISDIVRGKRAITPEMSLLLGKALGTSPMYWLNLESTYQLKLLQDQDLSDVVALVG
ncbi:addiction module antidote protein, HigA family [Collinsella sp. An307]|nr:addiction module antidote protein, HigA family [Collinsella sp. An307]